MEETFLCFESDAALFLVPLSLVRHIAPGKSRTGSIYMDKDVEVPVAAACRLWGKEDSGDGEYIVLLQGTDGLQGLLVSDVLGVYPVEPRDEREIPGAARGEHSSCLKKAVFLEALDRWSFILDESLILKIKGL